MTDERRPEETEAAAGALVTEPAPETAADETAATDEQPKKLHQTVEMHDVGPCKKHIKVTVERSDIDTLMDEKFSELVVDANVAGFRPGKAPRRIIERRYQRDVSEQVKNQVLLQSLEQLADDNDVAPLTAPDIQPSKIDIPKEGPLVYEFEVEVRPDFDLPNYRGLKLKRPVRTFTDEDILQEEKRILAPYGQLVPKPEGNAEIGDYLIVDMTSRCGARLLGKVKEATIRIDPRLALKDGVAENFAEQVKGVNAGDSRTVEIVLSDAVADPALRGVKIEATMDIKEVKSMRLPELTHEFLHNFGVHSAPQLRERIRVMLERRLEYEQRQSAREQVLDTITAAQQWQLPQELLIRQARRALSRRIMEMRSAGMAEEEIVARQRLLQQDIVKSTAQSLKEHFVLQKIAEVEKVDVDENDINDEIDRIAALNNESPRRLRARMEKEDLLEALAVEIIERKSLDLILQSADYEDVALGPQAAKSVSTVEQQAVPGEMHDPTEAPPEEAATSAATPSAEAKTPEPQS